MKNYFLLRFFMIFYLSWMVLYIHSRSVLCASEIDNQWQASVRGKYSRLLMVINTPEDKERYGPFCDYGFWFGSEYDGATEIPSGFWVYVYPNWYIWEKMSAELDLNPKTSANGIYCRLLHILEVPGDASVYGHYYNWGFSEEYTYAGYDNLTPGYWVYLEPNWYVWAEMKVLTQET